MEEYEKNLPRQVLPKEKPLLEKKKKRVLYIT